MRVLQGRTKSILASAALEMWLPIGLVVIWWVTSAASNNIYFPPLSEIFTHFADLWLFDGVTTDILPSMRNWFAGVGIAAIGGTLFGLLAGLVPYIADVTRPFTELFRAVPGLALVPLALLIFGIGPAMAIPLVAYGAFWPIFLNTLDGVRGMDPLIRDTRRIFRIGQIDWVIRIVFPATLPQLVVGIRQGLSIGISVIFFSEMMGATEGIGYVTRYAERRFETADMWAGIILLGLLGYAINLIFHFIEKRALAWHYKPRGTK